MKVSTASLSVLAVLCIVVLSVAFLLQPVRVANALTYTVTTTGWGGADRCEYLSGTAVWCATDSGIKVFNPTTRSTTATMYSGINVLDIECGGGGCFSWHTQTANNVMNLTRWGQSSFDLEQTIITAASGGHTLGFDIEVVPDQFNTVGQSTVIIPTVQGGCGGASGTLHGLCFLTSGNLTTVGRFISSGDTGSGHYNLALAWGGEYATSSDLTQNRLLVIYQDSGAGQHFWRKINLGDSDTDYSGTSICASGVLSGMGDDMDIYTDSGVFYIPQNVANSPANYLTLDSSSSSCASAGFLVTDYEAPNGVATDGEFWYAVSYNDDGSTPIESVLQVYNSTGDEVASFDTSSPTAAHVIYSMWYHSVEDEIHIQRGVTQVLVFDFGLGSGGDDDDSIGIDVDGDGIVDFVIEDTNGDGIPDFELGDVPLLVGNASETVPNLLVVLAGLDVDAAMTIVGILVPVGFVVALGLVVAKYDGELPLFVYGLVFLAGMGVSVTLGWLESWWIIVGIMGFIVSFATKIKGAFT